MADWADDIASTDDDVDEMLGDAFQFSPATGQPFVEFKGFVNPDEPDIALSSIDPLSDKPRIKVSRSKLAVPSLVHRFIVPQIAPAPTKWRPEQWTLVTKGRYWLIELQKAST